MISPRVFLFATLTLAAINNAQASLNLDAPVNFNYKAGDTLDINIFLQCVPKKATTLALYYQTENCNIYPGSCTGLAGFETIPENKTITIKKTLNEPSLTIYMELYKQTEETRLVNKTVIMKGSRDEYANINNVRKNCLNKQNQHYSKCQITVNFGNQCKERAVIIECTQKEHLTCEVGNEELPEDTEHQWYQVYENGSLIKHMPQLKGKKTEFKMKLHKFDNNTKIYSIMNSTHWQKDLVSQEFKVSLPKDGFKDYDIQNTIQYAEHEKIIFFCPNNTNTHVGWIDPTVENITLLNGTSFFGPISKKGNNGMFCCINYNISYVYNKMVVERIVYNITLIKVKPENQDNVKGSTSTTVQPHSQPSTHQPSSSEHGNNNPISLLWIIIAGIVGTILLLAIIYVIIKRLCRKSSDPDQTLQLETYGSTNVVLYAELDIRSGPTQSPPTVQDPTYAEIIGVLRPKSELVNK